MHTTLLSWSPLKPVDALELLDAKFADMHIRKYAVSRLEEMRDSELAGYVLQLVQVLKYEARHDSALARFLLRRALACPHQVGHQFFWCLKAEMHLPEVSERFGLYIQEYMRCCGPHRETIQLQCQVEQALIAAAYLVQSLPKSQRIPALRDELRKISFPPQFQLPLDPRFECSGLKVDKCKCMSSKKVWTSTVQPGPRSMLLAHRLHRLHRLHPPNFAPRFHPRTCVPNLVYRPGTLPPTV